MNYNEYMQALDKQLAIMSEEEKNHVIRNIARATQRGQRNEFLESLSTTEVTEDYVSSLYKRKKEIEEWCNQVEEYEIYFECRGHDHYGDSYWDRDSFYEYSDTFGMGKELTRAFQVAEDLLLHKEYRQAAELFCLLCSMDFHAFDDHMEDWNELTLEELVTEDLLSIDLKETALNLMYATYQGYENKERAEALYGYLTWNMSKDLKLDDFFTVGPEELKEIDLFMEQWIYFLKDTLGDRAGDLLAEACIYQGGDRLPEVAREVWDRHPIIYKYACERLLNEKRYTDCEILGLEALDKLSQKLFIRGEIADLVANAAEQLGHRDVIEKCYSTAFYSASTLDNYLRLFEITKYKGIVENAAKYARTLPDKPNNCYHNKQMQINYLSMVNKKVITFFSGEFSRVYEECKENKENLGWSTEFKGIAVPLFILLLDKNNQLTKAGGKLIGGIKHRLNFEGKCGINFEQVFFQWKEKMDLKDEQYQNYIEWLKEEVDKRTEAVVGGSHRKSYYKAAVLITALGETLESRGNFKARDSLIEHYKKMHFRKRAFKAEFNELNEG